MKKKSLTQSRIDKPTINIRIPIALKREAESRAQQNHRSMNGELVFLIERGLEAGVEG